MNTIKLFIDGSVNPQQKIGFGAYLMIEDTVFSSTLQEKIHVKKFLNTSSTLLELQTLLWSLEELPLSVAHVIIYTDCQNLIGLQKRCEAFEKNGYLTKQNKRIANHELYKVFYQKISNLSCEFIKIKGHQKSSYKNEIDDIFTLVDRASRNALRKVSYL